MRTRPRTVLGFSLIELVAAMAIFSVGVMACVELYSVSIRSTMNSLDHTQAVLLAQGRMEEILADGYLTEGDDSGDFGDTFPRFSWESAIEETDIRDLMQVRVTVTWQSPNGERSFELLTLHADRDTTSTTTTTDTPT